MDSTFPSKADYPALRESAPEVAPLGRLIALAKGGVDIPRPATEVDNQGSNKIARNGARGNCTKFINFRYLLVRDILKEAKV